ncbi:MAG: hypothetical protein LBG83_00685 [Oscillospiraceae bacterium]|jgi:hypothetical protein|nr:hypothetical protein [Oscillospiraceae bacterium]
MYHNASWEAYIQTEARRLLREAQEQKGFFRRLSKLLALDAIARAYRA